MEEDAEPDTGGCRGVEHLSGHGGIVSQGLLAEDELVAAAAPEQRLADVGVGRGRRRDDRDVESRQVGQGAADLDRRRDRGRRLAAERVDRGGEPHVVAQLDPTKRERRGTPEPDEDELASSEGVDRRFSHNGWACPGKLTFSSGRGRPRLPQSLPTRSRPSWRRSGRAHGSCAGRAIRMRACRSSSSHRTRCSRRSRPRRESGSSGSSRRACSSSSRTRRRTRGRPRCRTPSTPLRCCTRPTRASRRSSAWDGVCGASRSASTPPSSPRTGRRRKRNVDVAFVGVASPRRLRVLAEAAHALAANGTAIHLPDTSASPSGAVLDYLGGDERNALYAALVGRARRPAGR